MPTLNKRKMGRKIGVDSIESTADRSVPLRKEEMKHVAIVMQTRCGSWYSRHYHYNITVAEVPKNDSIEKIRSASERGSKVISRVTGKKVVVLTVQEVQITSQEAAKKISESFR